LEEDPASRPENDDEQVRHLTPLDLEPFITPLVNATRILSALSPCALQGAAGAAARLREASTGPANELHRG
jgi:hypothetical protein